MGVRFFCLLFSMILRGWDDECEDCGLIIESVERLVGCNCSMVQLCLL